MLKFLKRFLKITILKLAGEYWNENCYRTLKQKKKFVAIFLYIFLVVLLRLEHIWKEIYYSTYKIGIIFLIEPLL